MKNPKAPKGVMCRSCGKQADFICSCGCGATGCRKCVKAGRVG